MPVYTYRREDGTTFEIRQSFSDAALTQDPQTGQKVSRVVHNAGVIFKGSGFYKNDHKDSSKSNLSGGTKEAKDTEAAKPAESKPAESSAPAAAPAPASSSPAAD